MGEKITAPGSYPNVPDLYIPVLDDLYLYGEIGFRYETLNYEGDPTTEIRRQCEALQDEIRQRGHLPDVGGTLGFNEPPRDYIDGESVYTIGYALADLNNDGISELLLGSASGLKNASPHSIFTLKDGKPVLLESFWSRSRGHISADGIIYSVGSGGTAYTYLSSFRLDKNADTLTKLTEMFSDYLSSEEKSYFVQVLNGKNHYITEKEFWDFCERYDNPPKKMKLTVYLITS